MDVDVDVVADALWLWRSRASRTNHPDGTFDAQRRWYPSLDEQRACCDAIRSPSARWPYSLMTHCRSGEHVANLSGLEGEQRDAFLAATRTRESRVSFESEAFYKAVVVAQDGTFRSYYQTEIATYRFQAAAATEYRLGEELVQAVRRGHGGGYYAYASLERVQHMARALVAEGYEVAVLRVRVRGQHTTYPCECEACWMDGAVAEHAKHAFSRITPLEVVETHAPASAQEGAT
jgi:hypothetical protein